MRKNHPSSPEAGHGASYANLELRTGLHAKGMIKLLQAALPDSEKRAGNINVIDLDARDGTTTLALAKELPYAQVKGISEFRTPYLIGRLKAGNITEKEMDELGKSKDFWPSAVFEKAALEPKELKDRLTFENTSIEGVKPLQLGIADVAIGYQLLHWLNAESETDNLPSRASLGAIKDMLFPGGIFISGTSSGFVGVDSNATIEGMTRAEYVLDDHQFVRLDYQNIASLVAQITGKIPYASGSIKAKFKMHEITQRLEESGFINVRLGAFLVTPGIEEILSDQEGGVLMLRPMHQGRLDEIETQARKDAIMRTALMLTHRECDRLVAGGKTDPRTITDKNIWDAVPFVVAEKPG
ncbi:MAG: hypothetical protein AABX38_05245 [Candidatus Micrarchaeota archaeon]